MTLSDKAFNTLNCLRHASFLAWDEPYHVSDAEIAAVIEELAEYFKQSRPEAA